jgi:hypothetical protein
MGLVVVARQELLALKVVRVVLVVVMAEWDVQPLGELTEAAAEFGAQVLRALPFHLVQKVRFALFGLADHVEPHHSHRLT